MDWVDVTNHAAIRWHQHTSSPGVGPVVAWTQGEPCSPPTLEADEVRYHRPTDTLLLKKEGVLVTVIDVQTARPAIRSAVYSN